MNRRLAGLRMTMFGEEAVNLAGRICAAMAA
jgi:hypothetical protein